MNIKYIVNARIPTEKAHGYAISKLCEKLAELGADVELIVPDRKNHISENVYSYYGLNNTFKITYVKCFDIMPMANFLGPLIFKIQTYIFARSVVISKDNSLIISRDADLVSFFGQRNFCVFYDAHKFPEKNIDSFLSKIKYSKVVIANSINTGREYLDRGLKTVVAPNGVDLSEFNNAKPRNIHKEFNIPLSSAIVMYVGHLYDWKGGDFMIDLAGAVEKKNIFFVIIGGMPDDVSRLRERSKRYKNIIFTGHINRELVPGYMMSADILILPNTAEFTESVKYTSPIKLFEYMASKKPILASELPSVMEILDKSNAFFATPGDIESFSKMLDYILSNRQLATQYGLRAAEAVRKYTWVNRAEKIFNELNKIKCAE